MRPFISLLVVLFIGAWLGDKFPKFNVIGRIF